MKDGQLMQETYANKIYAAPLGGRVRSAIQITTAGGICAVLDMLKDGELPQAGLIRQEQIGLAAFLANRFGQCYASATPANPAMPANPANSATAAAAATVEFKLANS
jgi:saccharopine dehydrogenase-like NADP-dependent oxidoreductase